MLTPHDFGVVAVGLTATLRGRAGGGRDRKRHRQTPEPPERQELRTLSGIQLTLRFRICIPARTYRPQPRSERGGHGDHGRLDPDHDAPDARSGGAQQSHEVRPPDGRRLPRAGELLRVLRDRRGAGSGCLGACEATVVKASGGTSADRHARHRLPVAIAPKWRHSAGLPASASAFRPPRWRLVAREQGPQRVVAAVAGVYTLGLWNLANRLIQIPSSPSARLGRRYPAMSNLLAQGEDVGPIILRTVRRAAIVATLVFPVFAASSPGAGPGTLWRAVARSRGRHPLDRAVHADPWLDLGCHQRLPAAVGRPGLVAWATAAFGVVWIAVTAPLLGHGRGRDRRRESLRGARGGRTFNSPPAERGRGAVSAADASARSWRWSRAPRAGSCARPARRDS